jgi:hypothetical protein
MRPNRGIPKDLEEEAKAFFRRKGDVFVKVCKDERSVKVMNTRHDSEHVYTGKKDRKTSEEIIKPYCVVQ